MEQEKPQYPDTNLQKQARTGDIFGMFDSTTTAPTKTPQNWQGQIKIVMTTGATRAASAGFTIGQSYTILTVGTTDFTLIGARNNLVGTSFVATGAGSGTGTATLNLSTLYWYDTMHNTWAYVTQSNLI